MRLSDYKIELLDPAKKDEVEYVSHSRLRLYNTCPMAYRYKYEETKDAQDTPELVLGSALHKCFERYNRALLAGDSPPTLDVLREDFEEEIDGQSVGLYPKELLQLRREGPHLLATWLSNVEGLTPTSVEEEFLISIDGINVYGLIDVVYHEKEIVDYKTTNWPPRGGEADWSVQLSLYTLARYISTGSWPESSRLLYLDRKTHSAKWLPPDAKCRRSVGQICVAIEMVKDFHRNIKEGRFLATPSIACSWCAFKSECPAMPNCYTH